MSTETRIRIRWGDLIASLCTGILIAGFLVTMLANLIQL